LLPDRKTKDGQYNGRVLNGKQKMNGDYAWGEK
jgi:hypothetical protein